MPLASIVAHWMSGNWPDASAPVIAPIYGTACATLYISGARSRALVGGAIGSIQTACRPGGGGSFFVSGSGGSGSGGSGGGGGGGGGGSSPDGYAGSYTSDY